MKKIIINADDFGYSSGVNAGIIKAFQKGILTSTTFMANMPGANEAVELSKANPDLAIGGHLVLTAGRPMTEGNSLTNEEGNFYKLETYHEVKDKIDKEELYAEWCAQIDFLIDSGIELTHLDSHHHVHTFEENREVVKAIAEKYHIAFRNAYGLEEHVKLPNQKGIKGFGDLMNYPSIRSLSENYQRSKEACYKEIQAVLDTVTEDVTELMVHPAFVDETLYHGSSFNLQRIREVEILVDPEVKRLFEKAQFELVHYGNI